MSTAQSQKRRLPKGFILGPLVLNIFINDLDAGLDQTNPVILFQLGIFCDSMKYSIKSLVFITDL